MKITVAQLNPVIGDIKGNINKLAKVLQQAQQDTSDLVVFSELFLIGYPPRDLLEKDWFIGQIQSALIQIEKISAQYPEIGIILGAPQVNPAEGRGLYNSALLIHQGKVKAWQHKSLLPIYDVFDEARYFDPSPYIGVIPFKNQTLGISICEDAWNDPEFWSKHKMYSLNPIEILAEKGATIFINISASPFHVGKEALRFQLICNHARRHGVPFLYVNQVGGNDELIFDGRSMLADKNGQLVYTGPAFKECIKTIDISTSGINLAYTPQGKIESVYNALVLGLKDYITKCGFNKAILGLSGGIDSAVTCCLAAAAIGANNVLGISMPTKFSSSGSIEDSQNLADNLGIQFKVIPIQDIYNSYINSLGPDFLNKDIDITLQNIQARIRGNILMAHSNKFGHLLLSTGNKSELAIGYCTLYGDMSGGLSVLADVPKTMVYDLARFINNNTEIIPEDIITKPPSAELKPNQTDQDDLPSYDILDSILHYYIEEDLSIAQIINLGYDSGTVRLVVDAIHKNEYKRRQAPPGLKVTTEAFGVGRRMPIVTRVEI